MKKLMILGASILQLPAIKKAKDMGLSVVAVDKNPHAIGFEVAGIECEVISTIDTKRVLKAARKHCINGIMTLASDMPMRTIAVVAKDMGLVGITEETALCATDKAKMREAFASYGVPGPKYYRVSNQEEFFKAVDKIRQCGYRCIIKPTDNSGSRGVKLLAAFDDRTLESAYFYSRGYSRSGDLIVEEYMEGFEVSVETLSVNGVCHVVQMTDKLTTGEPHFVEMGHSQPSLLPNKVQETIKETVIAANKALGIVDGPSHTEVKVTKDGPKIVELGARLGGDNITTHLVPFSTGVNMVECCIHIALGEIPDYKRKYTKASAIRYFQTAEGIIRDIRGIEEATHISGVKQISVVHGIGERIKKIQNSIDRAGFVIAQADSVEAAVNSCESAQKKIRIIVE